jgi:hypothetical protein
VAEQETSADILESMGIDCKSAGALRWPTQSEGRSYARHQMPDAAMFSFSG